MSKRLYLSAVAVAALVLGGCKEKEETVIVPAAEPPAVAVPVAPITTLAQADQDFALQAASSGFAEVEASRAISEKTANASVREFAQTMVQDHTATNAELKRVADSKQLTLPTTPQPAHQDLLTALNAAMGAESDRVYVRDFGLKAHQEAVDLFDKQSREGLDPDLKAFAVATLPKLKVHLEHAQRLSESLPK